MSKKARIVAILATGIIGLALATFGLITSRTPITDQPWGAIVLIISGTALIPTATGLALMSVLSEQKGKQKDD